MKFTRRRVALWVVFVSFLVGASSHARKPEDVFAGKILTSDKRFPRSAKSPAQYVQKLKSQKKDRFVEDKEDKTWDIHYAAFFKRPVDSMEVTLMFYDVTTKGQRMVESYQQYLESRGERAIIGKLRLKRGDGTMGYNANSRILMVIKDGRRRVLASGRFTLIGEVKKNNGKVVFGEDET